MFKDVKIKDQLLSFYFQAKTQESMRPLWDIRVHSLIYNLDKPGHRDQRAFNKTTIHPFLLYFYLFHLGVHLTLNRQQNIPFYQHPQNLIIKKAIHKPLYICDSIIDHLPIILSEITITKYHFTIPPSEQYDPSNTILNFCS